MSLKLVQQQFCIYLNIILLTPSFSRLETGRFFCQQFENEVEPKGQKNKS